MRLFLTGLLLAVFMCGVLRAEEKKVKKLPDSMPVEAARDLDYAMYSRVRKAKKILAKYQKVINDELKKDAKDDDEIIEKIAKQYSLTLEVKHPNDLIDTVDPDTGKITRGVKPDQVRQ